LTARSHYLYIVHCTAVESILDVNTQWDKPPHTTWETILLTTSAVSNSSHSSPRNTFVQLKYPHKIREHATPNGTNVSANNNNNWYNYTNSEYRQRTDFWRPNNNETTHDVDHSITASQRVNAAVSWNGVSQMHRQLPKKASVKSIPLTETRLSSQSPVCCCWKTCIFIFPFFLLRKDQEADQRRCGQRLCKKTAKHVIWTGRML